MERKFSQATMDYDKKGSQVLITPQKNLGVETTTTGSTTTSPSTASTSPKSIQLVTTPTNTSVPVAAKRTVSMLNNNTVSPSIQELTRTSTSQGITRPPRPSKKSVADFLSASPRVKKRDTLRLLPTYIFRENKIGHLEELDSSTSKWTKKKIEIRDGIMNKYRAADAELELSAPLLGAEMKAYEPDKLDNAFSITLLSLPVNGKKGKNHTLIFRCGSPEEMQMWITVCLKSSFPASALQSQTNEDKTSILEFAAVLKEAEIQASSWKDLASKLKAHIDKKGWEKEWNVLEDREMKKLPSAFSEATIDENKLKNRYLNVLPLNQTRVKVTPTGDGFSTDYINANFVKSGSRMYIAAQAPLPNTFGDFFRMIWENNCEVIIMLTRWIENGKLKASNYIPEEQEEEDYDGMKVKVLQVEPSELEDVVITILQLKQGDAVRKLYHVHYVGWPDHGTLDKNTLDLLLKYVDERVMDKKNIQVVHCSAGIGRTGTWIIANFLQEEIQNHIKSGKKVMAVNMMQLLDFFRSQRSGTLTHSDQYLFLYHFLIDEVLKAASFEDKSTTTITTTTTATIDLPKKK